VIASANADERTITVRRIFRASVWSGCSCAQPAGGPVKVGGAVRFAGPRLSTCATALVEATALTAFSIVQVPFQRFYSSFQFPVIALGHRAEGISCAVSSL